MKIKSIAITLLLIIPLLTGCAALYSDMSPTQRTTQIWKDGNLIGKVVALKWPEVVASSRVMAGGILATIANDAMPVNLPQMAVEMLTWFDFVKKMNSVDTLLMTYAVDRLLGMVGVEIDVDGLVDVSGVDPDDLKAALEGYLVGLG